MMIRVVENPYKGMSVKELLEEYWFQVGLREDEVDGFSEEDINFILEELGKHKFCN